ncbi:AI-2E family transporter [Vibrio rumoiensis]|uniref:AI-2E family transporter n=1 Tax=Vibrio rumoiensis 1S-45 TaxID=1188252 RepID=A0A1E5E5G2_9VIBR|nr:AI-2E family transporter [Vibrio rumoiensis]OEF28647.1 AI-2E family transporter [Vibrio rumoiensis 1S-45]
MDKQLEAHNSKVFISNMIESSIRIGLLFVLLFWTYDIIKPFIIPVIWGVVIAVALMPLTQKLEKLLNGKRGLSATLLTIVAILLIVVPFFILSSSLFSFITDLVTSLHSGSFVIPGPSERIAQIPLVGHKIYDAWELFATNLKSALVQFLPQIKSAVTGTASLLGSGLVTLLMCIISLLIAAGFMTHAESSAKMLRTVAVRVVGKYGEDWTELTAATIRSVLLGVVGVAFIQSILVGSALFVFGIPGAGILSLGVLFLAIAQLPALIIVAPTIFYVFATHDTTGAVIFTVWALLAGLSDNFLKPILMGRGVDVPMPIILIGAIGGMLAAGIIGLFLGAVILAIWYQLFTTWLKMGENESPLAQQHEKKES